MTRDEAIDTIAADMAALDYRTFSNLDSKIQAAYRDRAEMAVDVLWPQVERLTQERDEARDEAAELLRSALTEHR